MPGRFLFIESLLDILPCGEFVELISRRFIGEKVIVEFKQSRGSGGLCKEARAEAFGSKHFNRSPACLFELFEFWVVTDINYLSYGM